MTKIEQTAEHILVTFVETFLGYIIVVPHVNWNKATIAGGVGAGLSAVYNMLRLSNPPVVTAPSVTEPAAAPVTEPVLPPPPSPTPELIQG